MSLSRPDARWLGRPSAQSTTGFFHGLARVPTKLRTLGEIRAIHALPPSLPINHLFYEYWLGQWDRVASAQCWRSISASQPLPPVGTTGWDSGPAQHRLTVLTLVKPHPTMAIPDHLLPSINAGTGNLASQIQSVLCKLPGAVTTQALLMLIGQPVNRSTQTAAGIVLTRLGYQKTRLRFDGERGYIYRPPVA